MIKVSDALSLSTADLSSSFDFIPIAEARGIGAEPRRKDISQLTTFGLDWTAVHLELRVEVEDREAI